MLSYLFICSTGLDGGRFAEYHQKLCRKWEVPCPEVVILSAFILGSSEPEETEQFHFRSAAAATQLKINNNFCLPVAPLTLGRISLPLLGNNMHPFFFCIIVTALDLSGAEQASRVPTLNPPPRCDVSSDGC